MPPVSDEDRQARIDTLTMRLARMGPQRRRGDPAEAKLISTELAVLTAAESLAQAASSQEAEHAPQNAR
jgi:hypothetical protein